MMSTCPKKRKTYGHSDVHRACLATDHGWLAIVLPKSYSTHSPRLMWCSRIPVVCHDVEYDVGMMYVNCVNLGDEGLE